MTLPEMMTAVAITLIMLAASGMIFSSASKSSGKAMALNDMMTEARAIIGQLESDFAGYRDDLPITLVFEGYDFIVDSNLDGSPESDYLERRDRVSFFTNGDFQDMYGNGSTLMARVLYSQSGDTVNNSNTEIPGASMGIAPLQRALCRQMKMITNNDTNSAGAYINPLYAGSHYAKNYWQQYELEIFEYGPEYLWKSADNNSYSSSWWLYEDASGTSNNISFIRRPDYDLFYKQDVLITKNASYSLQRKNQYKQRSCVVTDCTDFTVQVWIKPPGEFAYRWFPTNWDLEIMSDSTTRSYWNDKSKLNQPTPCIGISWNIDENHLMPFGYGYYIDGSIKYLFPDYLFPDYDRTAFAPPEKPKAFKFTFKLHDKGRTHFPEGKKFTYIIDVRDKD